MADTTLDLFCYKCTRGAAYDSADYDGFTLAAAVQAAKDLGWAMDGERFICPRCPK